MNSRKLNYRVKVYGDNKRGVVFFFCPYATRRWQFLLPLLPIWRMTEAGYQVVCYDFSLSTGNDSPQKSIDVLQSVNNDVKNRADRYSKEGITDLSCFGISMGSLFAAYSSTSNPSIQSVILNLPYGNIADHILEFKGMIFLPKSAVKRYVNAAGGADKLKEMLAGYSPIAFADKLSKKRILLYHSLNDKVLKYDNVVQLKNLLEKHNTDLTYIENKPFGHYISALINNFRGSIYMNFLNGNK